MTPADVLPKCCRSWLALAAVLSLPLTAKASERWYVRIQAVGAATGKNWTDAFTHVQSALAVATSGDDIWIAAGSYQPDAGSGDQSAVFSMRSGVSLYGGFAGTEVVLSQRDPKTNETVLDGDLQQDDQANFLNFTDNSDRVVVIDAPGSAVLIDGISIRGGRGSADLITHAGDAGGITITNAAVTLVDCTIRDNKTYALGTGSGGLSVHDNAHVTLLGCTLTNNRAVKANGGALQVRTGSTASAVNCRFVGNRSYYGGGAIDIFDGTAEFVNCLVVGNETEISGGGIQTVQSTTDIIHCTIANNHCKAGTGGGVAQADPGSVHLSNTILWDNVSSSSFPQTQQVAAQSELVLAYCCLMPPQDPLGGTGLDFSDPVFVDAVGADAVAGTLDDDYRLQPSSSCIDSGSNQLFAHDVQDLDGDGNVVEPVWCDGMSVPRYVDQPSVIDLGSGPPPICDIGAFEFSGWTNLKKALEGTNGVVPSVVPSGDWIPSRDVSVDLNGGSPGSLVAFVLSSVIMNAPFKGGILVPAPEESFVTTLDAAGHVTVTAKVPVTEPLGEQVVFQPWILDVGAPFGASAGQAFVGTVHP